MKTDGCRRRQMESHTLFMIVKDEHYYTVDSFVIILLFEVRVFLVFLREVSDWSS